MDAVDWSMNVTRAELCTYGLDVMQRGCIAYAMSVSIAEA